MTKKSKIILIIIIVVLIILAAIYFFFFYHKEYIPWQPEGATTPEVGVPQEPVVTPTGEQEKEPAPVVDAEAIEKAQIVQLASSAAEILGSYSNQSDYENIIALKSRMTDKMKAWADNFIKQQKSKRVQGEPYWGVTTRTISTDMESVDLTGGAAQVIVSTQRHETTDETAKVYYQDAVLQMVKEGGGWKVDVVTWENK